MRVRVCVVISLREASHAPGKQTRTRHGERAAERCWCDERKARFYEEEEEEEEPTDAPRGGEKEQRGNETRGWTFVGGLTLYLLAREVVYAPIVQVLRFRRFLHTTSHSCEAKKGNLIK